MPKSKVHSIKLSHKCSDEDLDALFAKKTKPVAKASFAFAEEDDLLSLTKKSGSKKADDDLFGLVSKKSQPKKTSVANFDLSNFNVDDYVSKPSGGLFE